MSDNELYDDFLKSLEAKKYCPIMVHWPSNVTLARRFFEGYLSKEELQERQYQGRYWDLVEAVGGLYKLYIILDNETVLCVMTTYKDPISERIMDIGSVDLPDSLKGRYYN